MSDCATQFAPAPAVGNNFSISITAETREQRADALCAKLSDGGSVTCRSARRSGAPTSACAPTALASTGW